MKVLLVNTNRQKSPPLIPVGLEYLVTALENANHKISVLDLCFLKESFNELISRIKSQDPKIVVLSFLQADTVLYRNNRCFIDELVKYVEIVHKFNKHVVLEGSGFSIMPAELLSLTKADFGIAGSGEIALPRLLDEIEHVQLPKPGAKSRLVDGYVAGILPNTVHKRGRYIDYASYVQDGGVIGFSTHVGCSEGCIFCPEAKARIIFREPKAVASELMYIVNQGYSDFHLCDSEFNEDLAYCIKVCSEISNINSRIKWSAYVKYQPFNQDFFRAMADAGVYMVTLSLETKPDKPYTLQRLTNFFLFAENAGINVVVDLLVGFPYEKPEEARILFDFLKTQPISSIGVNNYIRVYPYCKIRKIIESDEALRKKLVFTRGKADYVYPTFFKWFSDEEVKEFMGDTKNFRLEGAESICSYQRVKFHEKSSYKSGYKPLRIKRRE
ncbi:MAG: cobalamin-dependent protein, partial [Elusimicrobiota bacterium]